MGNDPGHFFFFRHGRSGYAATCRISREGGATINICVALFYSIALVLLHACGLSL